MDYLLFLAQTGPTDSSDLMSELVGVTCCAGVIWLLLVVAFVAGISWVVYRVLKHQQII